MAYTSQQLADLRAAIAEGVLSITESNGHQVTFRSLADMRRIEAAMAAELEISQPRIKRTVYIASRYQ